MDFKQLKGLTDIYAAVYDQDLREEILTVEEDFEFVDELSDNDLDRIMENILEEGEVTLSECSYAFDGALLQEQTILSEARPTARSQAERAQRRSERAGEREASVAAKRKEDRINRVKSAVDRAKTRVTGAVDKVKTRGAGAVSAVAGGAAELGRKAKAGAEKVQGKLKSAKEKIKGFIKKAKDVVDVPAREYASNRQLIPSKSGKSKLRADAIQGKQRTSAGRREVRGAVVGDIAQRAKEKVGQKVAQTQVDIARRGREAGQAVSDAGNRTRQSAANATTRTKRGIKGAISRVASNVASGASRLAARMATEEYVVYAILEDLIQEGYADTYEDALYIIESLEDNEADELIESYLEEETYDVYDVILEYLCTEGYADTLEDAEAIMVNMSEDWRDTIIGENTEQRWAEVRRAASIRHSSDKPVVQAPPSPEVKERRKNRESSTGTKRLQFTDNSQNDPYGGQRRR